MDVGKRHRIAPELAADGFGEPLFDYRLLDVPKSVAAYRTGYQYQPPAVPAAAAAVGSSSSSSLSSPPESEIEEKENDPEEAEVAEDDEMESSGDSYSEYSHTESESESDGDSTGEYDPTVGALTASRSYPSTRKQFRLYPRKTHQP